MTIIRGTKATPEEITVMLADNEREKRAEEDIAQRKQLQPAQETGEWQQVNSTVCELTTDERGEQVNRWSATVQGPRLRPGEAEEIAARMIADHNAVPRLAEALRQIESGYHSDTCGAMLTKTAECDCHVSIARLTLTTLRREG